MITRVMLLVPVSDRPSFVSSLMCSRNHSDKYLNGVDDILLVEGNQFLPGSIG